MIDKDTFCEQIRLHEKAMYYLAFSLVQNEADAADVIGEAMLMYGREAQSKTKTASPATIPKSGERNRKIHSCMLYLISI